MIQVTCYTVNLEKININLDDKPRVIDLMKKLAELKKTDFYNVTLVYKGKYLNKMYEDLEIDEDNNKFVVMFDNKNYQQKEDEEDEEDEDSDCMCDACTGIEQHSSDDSDLDQEDRESDSNLDQEDSDLDPDSPRPIFVIHHDDIENDVPPVQLTELDRSNIADIVLTCQVSLPIAISFYLAGNKDKNLACSLIFDNINS